MVNYYKNTNSIGMKRKWGAKAQAFSFGGLKCTLSEKSLRGFADDVMRKLDRGMSEKEVKDWAVRAIS
jgi:hypothetical protein